MNKKIIIEIYVYILMVVLSHIQISEVIGFLYLFILVHTIEV